MKVAEAASNLIKAVREASVTVKEFELSMKGVSRAMKIIQSKKLNAHGLSKDVVEHYSQLYARRKLESIQKNVKRQKKEVRKEVIKKTLQEKKSIPKLLKDKLESEVKDDGTSVAFNPFILQDSSAVNQPLNYHGVVIIPLEREHLIREVKNVRVSDLQEDADKPVPDMLNQKIVEKAQKILRRNPKLREPRINAKEFKRKVAEEIEREISKEEQRDLQEKVVLRRRRKVIRRKD